MPKWDGKKAHENLLPLSKERVEFGLAVREWEWTGGFLVASENLSGTCQLCENKGLIYHYEILNKQTENILWVGSSCIIRFDIAVYDDDGKLLEGSKKKKKLDDKIRENEIERALEPLRNLWKVDINNRDRVRDLAEEFKLQDGKVSPKDLLFLFKQMNAYGINFEFDLYQIRLRSAWEKNQLLQMLEDELGIIWKCLTDKQKESYRQEKVKVEEIEHKKKLIMERAEKQLRENIGGQTQPVPELQKAGREQPINAQRESILAPLIHYDERAHKYTILFLDQKLAPLRVLYRGDEQFCTKFAANEIKNYPPGTIVQVLITKTKEIVYQISK